MDTGTGLRGFVRLAFAGPVVRAVPIRPDRISDPVIDRLQRARTVLGLLAGVWLVMAYPMRKGREDFVLGKVENLMIGCGVLVAAGAVGITVFIVAARPPLRRLYARRLVSPLTVLGVLVLEMGMFWLMLQAVRGNVLSPDGLNAWLSESHDSEAGAGTVLLGLVLGLLALLAPIAYFVLMLISAVLILVTTYSALNSCFRVGDVHELLPGLLSPLLFWSLFFLSLSDDPDVSAPPEVLYAFLLGGPLSVTALSVWEIRRLRTKYGMNLRTALAR
ncbi:hypothetical protein [Streptomyces scabiei]|uniref:hypothetical protein n=1 Tax=Streptomyces scabiei TaxID=1930 RepID=UPI0029B6BF10|nr:hypothetical protein [Streptomyces scabiei]MDX3521364.1 hypothetical protein [Streptomyces scabiei]